MKRLVDDRAAAGMPRGGPAAQTPIGDPDDDDWESDDVDDDEEEDDEDDDDEEPLQAATPARASDLLRRIIDTRAGIGQPPVTFASYSGHNVLAPSAPPE